MTSQEIRKQFLDFFKNKKHRIVESAPVVPFDDPTLLFTNAGMNQFKDVFLGTGTREYSRAADTQKCIRVSGKHNDLEEVGHDTYHHTFFEMLGNWSFGDYYKEDAIVWAWELLTEIWKLPKERFWATVYKDDNEAYDLWKTKTDINPDHILRFDEKDNFWEMGEVGPCGPCSEIHINLGDDFDNPKYVNAGSPECIEIWNLVFIQYNRDEKGNLHELPAKHVDTGMGFERVCAVLQDKDSNYDTDVFMPLINKISELSGIKYEEDDVKIAMRVIADHIRALTFAIADGAVPGNEGRGYVLRRILRRAARYGRNISLKDPFLFKLVDVLSETMGDVFTELTEKKDYIKKVIKAEEESFNATLGRGIELFNEIVTKLEKGNKKQVSGEDAFKLYDTFGFPIDLTNVMAKEKGFTVEEKRFNELMDQQKKRARDASKDKFASSEFNADNLSSFDIIENKTTEFTGYDSTETEAKVIGIKKDKENIFVILDRSPFYVESGGQIDDSGSLIKNGYEFKVTDLIKSENKIIHVAMGEDLSKLNTGDVVKAVVDSERRWDIMRNHSATHLLHTALRTVLGSHVQQAGSYVGSDYLRFDFTHFSKVKDDELDQIEKLVNKKIRENLPLHPHRNIPFEDAKKMGALMFFGDKYGDKVNVIQFGDFTKEFCGGTHVQNTAQIGMFKIVSESSIASGVRRIEAVTGKGVERYIEEKEQSLQLLMQGIESLNDHKRKLEKEIAELKMQDKLGQLEHILALTTDASGVKVYKGRVHADSMDEMKSFGDELRNSIKSGVGVLIAEINQKVGILVVVSDDLIKDKKLNAGKIVSELAKIVGGGGGGRPQLATAGGKDISKINSAITEVENVVSSILQKKS